MNDITVVKQKLNIPAGIEYRKDCALLYTLRFLHGPFPPLFGCQSTLSVLQ